MKKKIIFGTLILSFCFLAYKSQEKTHSKNPKINSEKTQKINDMKTYISIFEIPATEISRAIDFYQAILDINIEKMEFPDMKMGILPYEGQMVTGVLVQGEGNKPSADGVTIYLNGGDNLQNILDKVEINGGQIIVPKSLHADGKEYYAIFLDSEGNKMGLHSPN
jgi:predicted enzyme related to lactoylglutathione lyase